jgi:hypothetical protein
MVDQGRKALPDNTPSKGIIQQGFLFHLKPRRVVPLGCLIV